MKKTLFSLITGLLLIGGAPITGYADTLCTPHDYLIVSDTETRTDTNVPAVLAYDESGFWVSIAGAEWIWDSYLVTDPINETTVTFTRNFSIKGNPVVAEIAIAGDDFYSVSINGTEIVYEYDVLTIESNFTEVKRFPIAANLLQEGSNTLVVEATNAAYLYGNIATPYDNPAGVIFVLSLETQICENTTTQGGGNGGSNSGGGSDAQFVNAFQGGVGGNPTDNSLNNIPATFESQILAQTSGSQNDLSDPIEQTDTETPTQNNPLLASAASVLTDLDLTCSLIALIIVVLLYIIWLLLPQNRTAYDSSLRKHQLDLYALTYFIGGLVIMLIALILLSLNCVVTPLIIMFALMLLGIHFKII